MALEQLPPHNAEAEENVIGSILIDQDAIWRVADLVRPTDFYNADLGWLYGSMLTLAKAGKPPDLFHITDLIERRNKKIKASNLTMLLETPTSLYAEHYADIVRRMAERRRLIVYAQKLTKEAYDLNSADPEGFAHQELMTITSGRNGHRTIAGVAGSLYDRLEQWANDPLEFGQVRGLSTGIDSIDHLTEGLEVELVMLAARPSMGKSALAFEIARKVAVRGQRVIIFSLEMNTEQILMRWASCQSQVESRRVKRGICPVEYESRDTARRYVSAGEYGRYMAAMAELSELQTVHIDDEPGLGIAEIRARAMRQANVFGGIDLIIVDHTDLISARGIRADNTVQIEGAKSRELKNLAKELRCPVLLVQQLNRSLEARQNKRPQLHDLRNSGEHEQNADVVLALYRESYYLERAGSPPPPDSKEALSLEIIALKNRENPCGTRTIRYEANLHRFTEFAL